MAALLPVVQRLPGREGGGLHEDSIDTLAQLQGSPEIHAAVWAYMGGVLLYNVSGACLGCGCYGRCGGGVAGLVPAAQSSNETRSIIQCAGMLVTDGLGATTRTVLESFKTLLLWVSAIQSCPGLLLCCQALQAAAQHVLLLVGRVRFHASRAALEPMNAAAVTHPLGPPTPPHHHHHHRRYSTCWPGTPAAQSASWASPGQRTAGCRQGQGVAALRCKRRRHGEMLPLLETGFASHCYHCAGAPCPFPSHRR